MLPELTKAEPPDDGGRRFSIFPVVAGRHAVIGIMTRR
jgi:hypothetical protein